MYPSPSILLFGHDRILLETRTLVLERGGCNVSVTSDLQDAIGRIDAELVDLLILCHTLSPEECAAILCHTQPLLSLMKVVALDAACIDCERNLDVEWRISAKPLAILSAVQELNEIYVALPE